MARFVTIPAVITLLHPLTDEPYQDETGQRVTTKFADTIRALMVDPRMQERFDTYALNDLRRKLTRAPAGDIVEISDAEQDALSKCCLDKPTLALPLRFSGEEHFRAITDAPTKDPRPKAEKKK